MKIPSIAEIMSALQDILTIFSEGGQKAIALIFILNVVMAFSTCYFVIRFISNFLKEYNDDREKALAAKDELLNASRQRAELLNEQYAKLVTQSIERENLVMTELRELKTLVTLFITNRNNH